MAVIRLDQILEYESNIDQILEYYKFTSLYFEKEVKNETLNSQSKKNIKIKGICKEKQTE